MIGVLIRGGEETQRWTHTGHVTTGRVEGCGHKPRITKDGPADPLISDFCSQSCERTDFCCSSPHVRHVVVWPQDTDTGTQGGREARQTQVTFVEWPNPSLPRGAPPPGPSVCRSHGVPAPGGGDKRACLLGIEGPAAHLPAAHLPAESCF